MNNKKENIKEKISLKQLAITIIILILLILIGYTLPINESNNEFSQENITIDSNIEIDNIPPYSGKLVITINNDMPYFEDEDISTENFEDYSKLDDFDRAGAAFANICKYTMPPDGTKRGNISYKPTGWVQYLYRVTPIYEGENKLATGVQIEAKSVEEEGVCFNKFIYNVQDNFEIDYSTGEAKLIK